MKSSQRVLQCELTLSIFARRHLMMSNMSTRREFVKTGTAALGLAALGSRRADALAAFDATTPAPIGAAPMDAGVKTLLMDALNAAKMAGAGYADARIGH